MPLRKTRAVANTFGGTILLSVPNVLNTLDNGDGMESPYEFSARTKNIYDVAGFSSVICNKNSILSKQIKLSLSESGWEAESKRVPLEI